MKGVEKLGLRCYSQRLEEDDTKDVRSSDHASIFSRSIQSQGRRVASVSYPTLVSTGKSDLPTDLGAWRYW